MAMHFVAGMDARRLLRGERGDGDGGGGGVGRGGVWAGGRRSGNAAISRRVGFGLGAIAAAAGAIVVARAVSGAMHPPTPPLLAKKEHQVLFGAVEGSNRGSNPMSPPASREDPYFWVRDDRRENAEMLEHLRRENAYTEHVMKPLKRSCERLYDELLSHVQQTDSSVPYRHGPYMYYTRTVEGSSYRIHCRRAAGEAAAPEDVILDENELARGLKHCDVRAVMPSPSHRLLAYTVDTTGYETYELRVIDLGASDAQQRAAPVDSVTATAGVVSWGRDDSELFYSTKDDAQRVDKVWRHRLAWRQQRGAEEGDALLLEERDPLFSAFFGKERSGDILLLGSESSETSEYYFIDLRRGSAAADRRLVARRESGTLYDVTHWRGELYMVTNRDGARNFKLMRAPLDDPSPSRWADVFPYDEAVKIDGLSAFRDFAVLSGRQDGFTQLWLLDGGGGDEAPRRRRLEFEEDAYVVHPSVNREFDAQDFRFMYSSLTTPAQTWEVDARSDRRRLLKDEPVPNFDRSRYASRRIDTVAADGTRIPISLVYRKGLLDGGEPRPCYLYGYGSYEISIDPSFRSSYLPIVDRDAVVALAHIRGGGELGRLHYEEAKYLKKKNTFTDFVSCAEELIRRDITAPDRLVIEGRSAGGLLVGAVLNMRPDLFRAAHAGVPFVDVMNTMCDSTIPLTTGEWEEWGNPNEEQYFSYMLSYSPYDNVHQAEYPALLVTSGLWDPRVAYWEPIKWVAKLREFNRSGRPVLLKMDLSSGHFSASDRYKWYRERAFELSFLLDQMGVLERA